MATTKLTADMKASRASYEACELKSGMDTEDNADKSRASYEACELKFLDTGSNILPILVGPRMRPVN